MLGTVLAVEALGDKIGLNKTFSDIARAYKLSDPYERALLAMTANRLCSPESNPSVWERCLETVYLPSYQGLQLCHMYEAMDMLYAHAEEVKKTYSFILPT